MTAQKPGMMDTGHGILKQYQPCLDQLRNLLVPVLKMYHNVLNHNMGNVGIPGSRNPIEYMRKRRCSLRNILMIQACSP
ncbi:hypothetical protein GF351_02630 [Candidatus Woesearchaeota archaeon]|nr:hypothetical protein [Candidatus Woesearchaeota archaeon]